MSIIASQYITGRKIVYLYIFHVYKDCNIFSAYSLCSHLPFEELTASLTSVGTLSVLVVELVASMGAAGTSLCTLTGGAITASPTSAYSLSTAVKK